MSHVFAHKDPREISNILIHLHEKSFSPINQTSQSPVRDTHPESPIRSPEIHENRRTLMESFVKNSILQIGVLTVLFRSFEFSWEIQKKKLPNDKNFPPSSHVNLCLLQNLQDACMVAALYPLHARWDDRANGLTGTMIGGEIFPLFSLTRCKFHILYIRRKSLGEIWKGKVMEKLKNFRAMDTPSRDFQFGCKLSPNFLSLARFSR